MNRPRALLLDLDETLLDGRGLAESIGQTCAEVAAKHPQLERARLAAANAEAWSRYWPEVEMKWVLGALDGAAVMSDVWRRTLRACDCADESVARFAFETHRPLARAAHRLFGDAHELLAAARRANVPLALITNGASDTQREKLAVLQLEPAFAAIVISGELGVAKPERAPFEAALRALGISAGEAWHVGDSASDDVAGARAAGVGAVWLNRSGRARRPGEPQPDLEIRSLRELVGPVLTPVYA
ncbi:MAG TPA: HAD family hydrolase [Myxococcota bacterium]|nr:HAD family hydrolase [Myxococcota bacterium]